MVSVEASMAIASEKNGNDSSKNRARTSEKIVKNAASNGRKSGRKSVAKKKTATKKNGRDSSATKGLTAGTVWVGDAAACLNQTQRWLELQGSQLDNLPAVITPSPQAARALGVPWRSLDQWATTSLHPLNTASIIVTHRLIRSAVAKYWEKTTDLAATAQRILPTVRQYFRAGLDLEQLRDCSTVSTRARQIAQIAIAYQAALRSRRLIDEAELFNITAKNVITANNVQENADDFRADSPVLVHGYPWLRLDEARFIVNAAPSGSSIGLDPVAEEAIALFQEAGWEIIQLPETSPATSVAPQAYSFANGAAEVRWALGQVKQWLLEGVPPRQIALVARDDRTYGEWLADVAWDYQTPVRLLFSIPLMATRVGGWVQDLLEAATSNFPFETTAKLLRHPLCGYGVVVDPSLIIGGEGSEPTNVELDAAENSTGESSLDRGNDELDSSSDEAGEDEAPVISGDDWWHLARRRHPEGLNAWTDIGIDLKSWLEPVTAKQTRTEWIGWLGSVIFKAKLRQRAARWARETGAIATLRQQLVALERFQEFHQTPQPKAARTTLTLTQFADEIRDVLSLVTVPAEPGRAGVELHQPRAMVGSRYDHVIVLGAMEGTLPEPIVNDPVVDFYERKRLTRAGFPLDSAATLARREWHCFQHAVAAAGRSLTLTYPKLVGKEEKLPSAFLDRVGVKESDIAPGPVNPPANWSETYRAFLPFAADRDRLTDFTADKLEVLSRVHQSWTVEKRRESVGAADEYDGAIGLGIEPRDRIFSASQITAIGQCGFKWFAERLLRSRDLPEADDGMSAAKGGTFYHRVLEILLDLWRLDSAEKCLEKLEEAVELAASEMRLDTILTWQSQRPEMTAILRRAIASEWFMPEGTEFLKGESKFDGEWHGLRVTGQLDRIDRRPTVDGDNGLVIIDYKTGKLFPKGAKNNEGKAKLDVQLALYKDVAPHDPNLSELPEDEAIADAFYFSIKAGDRLSPTKKDQANQDSQLVNLAERVKATLFEGQYLVQPDRDRHACQYCAAKLACRQGDRLARKISPRFSDDNADFKSEE
ncbi:MAG: PD-(D/E)XK nuclease family protein [Cyanobacteria bacterium P01_D01_bin.73]